METETSLIRRRAGRWRDALLSVPVHVKVLGIGGLVAAVFAGITLFSVRLSVGATLRELVARRARFTAQLVGHALGQDAASAPNQTQHTRLTLEEARLAAPDLAYAAVLDASGQTQFSLGVLPDLGANAAEALADSKTQSVEIAGGDETIILASARAGKGVTVLVGFSQALVREQLGIVTRGVLMGLGVCMGLGALLAFALTRLLTRPILHLVGVTNRLQEGDYEARARVYAPDEIGRLAEAFNALAGSLRDQRDEVALRQRERIALIDRVVQVQEDERRAISQELHDQVGQSLLALLLTIQASPRLKELAGSLCLDLEQRVRQIIDEVKRLAWGMRPSILDDYGLERALARYVEELQGLDQVEIDYEANIAPGLPRLPGRLEITLYRIAQEALANTLRHARARHASVVLLRRAHDVTLLIEDDGQGFEPAEPARQDGHLGLTGMRERASLVGGSFALESAPGQGTTVTVRIPLEETTDADSTAPRG